MNAETAVAAGSSVASFPVNKADVVMEAVMLTRAGKDCVETMTAMTTKRRTPSRSSHEPSSRRTMFQPAPKFLNAVFKT